jgi:hypothetical protein
LAVGTRLAYTEYLQGGVRRGEGRAVGVAGCKRAHMGVWGLARRGRDDTCKCTWLGRGAEGCRGGWRERARRRGPHRIWMSNVLAYCSLKTHHMTMHENSRPLEENSTQCQPLRK